jgi:hypothetical protein
LGFRSLQHVRNRRSTHAGSPTRYVPPPGFGYPLDGLLPSSPCRFFFTPAALLGFTLRSIALPQGIRGVTTRMNPLTVPPIGAPAAVAMGRPNEPRFLGFHPCQESLATGRRFSPPTAGCSLGFRPSRVRPRKPCPSLHPGSSLTLRATGDYSPVAPASQSLNRLSPGPIASPARRLTTDGTTLLGFLHRLNPMHANEQPTGL